MHTLYTSLKVNNEIELCEVDNPECKAIIEKEFLRNRISYYIKWPKINPFSRKRNTCVMCINENVVDAAAEVVEQVCNDHGFQVRFLMKKSNSSMDLL